MISYEELIDQILNWMVGLCRLGPSLGALLFVQAGVNYCSSAPCPPGCNETEVACGTNDGVEFCAPKER